MTDLLHCPFCGESPQHDAIVDDVWCANANCAVGRIGAGDRVDAELWNRRATPAPESPNVVTIPRLSAEKAVRAMALCDREYSGWGKYAKPIVDALAASQGAAQATEQKGDSRIASSLGRFEVGYDPSAAQATEQKGEVTDEQIHWFSRVSDRVARDLAEEGWDSGGDREEWRSDVENAVTVALLTNPAPSADRSAKAVAEPVGYVNPKALVELKKLGRMGSCNLWNTPSDTCTVGLYTAPPAQPASPGPLQPGASRVTDEHFIIGLRLALCQPDIDQDDIDTAREHAKLIAARAALSADHDAKEAK